MTEGVSILLGGEMGFCNEIIFRIDFYTKPLNTFEAIEHRYKFQIWIPLLINFVLEFFF